MKYKFICYAYDSEDAPILVIANSEKEMLEDAKEFEGIWYRYEFDKNEARNGECLGPQ